MTKKDYIKIAKLIKENTINLCEVYNDDINRFYISRDNIIDGLCEIFLEDNERFKKDVFKKACGIN